LQEAAEMAKALQVELIILTVAEEIDREKAEQISVDGLKLAKAHECNAVNMVGEDDADTAILEISREQECDLIVVGAYGHSHIREMIIGSTTANIINQADVPILVVR
jgi:nucleotide-binding universal stress UspA family protein